MDYSAYINMFLMLGLVLSVIYGMGLLLKKYKNPLFGNKFSGKLQITDQIMLDAKRKLIVIDKEGEEFFILISPQGDTIMPISTHNYEKKTIKPVKNFKKILENEK